MVAVMAFQTCIRSKAGGMTIFAGCAMMVGAASFAATIGVLEVPVVDGMTGRTVGTESSMVSRRVMTGGTGR